MNHPINCRQFSFLPLNEGGKKRKIYDFHFLKLKGASTEEKQQQDYLPKPLFSFYVIASPSARLELLRDVEQLVAICRIMKWRSKFSAELRCTQAPEFCFGDLGFPSLSFPVNAYVCCFPSPIIVGVCMLYFFSGLSVLLIVCGKQEASQKWFSFPFKA